MSDEYCIRALYDETRTAYFIPDSDLPKGIVEIRYTFVLLDTGEPEGTLTHEGAVQKAWREQDEDWWDSVFFVFQEYPDQLGCVDISS